MKIGLVGLGNMGKGIGKNILHSPKVQALNVIETVKLNEENFVLSIVEEDRRRLNVCNSLNMVTAKSDIIALSLPSEEATLNVLFGENGISKSFKQNKALTICDHGTFSRDFILHNEKRLKESGISYVDAPVSGGPGGATAGTLTIMAGGDINVISTCKPLWELYSSNIFHFGGIGCGMAAKLINQALVGVHAQAACEALYLAESMGITDITTLQSMLRTSWGQSKILDLTMADYISGTEKGWAELDQSMAPLRNLKKDFACVLQNSPQNIPLTQATGKFITDACSIEKGLENTAFVGLIKLLRK